MPHVAATPGSADMTKQITTRWITVLMERHADFGGGVVEADLPDTPAHRAMYTGRIVRVWQEVLDA